MAIEAFRGVSAVVKAIDLASRWRGGSKAADELQASAREAQELALRQWGCLLFEMRRNLERIRFMVQQSEDKKVSYAPFDLTVSEALMPDFCRIVPSPALLSEIQGVLAAIKRVDFYQRTGATAAPLNISQIEEYTILADDIRGFRKANAFARDAVSKNVYDRFNRLHALANEVGKQLYGDEWDGEATYTLPSRLDTAADIRHDLL